MDDSSLRAVMSLTKDWTSADHADVGANSELVYCARSLVASIIRRRIDGCAVAFKARYIFVYRTSGLCRLATPTWD
jgi:hypothetical protein